jgi:TolB-like protein/predicted Ser/Thr protein kinase/Tfp pilus assembly protein PilF
MVGTTLGRYRILEPLGAGGMGRVFLAEDPALARRVAIKVLSSEAAGSEASRARLLLEARAASGLNHPHIVTVYDVGEQDGTLYVAMERIDGVTLRAWAAERRREPAEILGVVRQATRALAVAHAQGLVHRDLKPENMMVRRDGILKVLDFGLARSTSLEIGQATVLESTPGTILGTAPYMSPEQVLGQPAGPASDVFSMGTIVHELLTGRHPFAAANPVEIMHRILQETPVAPSTLVPGLPAAIDFVLAKAFARDVARRYANAHDLDVDLESCEAALASAAAGSRAREAPPAGKPGAAAPRTIAVLPFKQIGGAEDLDWLGIGLADALITRLSTSPDLVVRATSSIARYEKTPVDPRHVARELEVGAVLDASFQRAGTRFRARARLIEEPGGRALWAGTIDLDFDDIFNVQDEVARGIATAMSARLRGERERYTPSPEAFELYLRSKEPDRTGTKEGMLRKMALAERAVELEPGYADAWAYLAKLRHSFFDTGFDFDEAWVRKAQEACSRALAIDPEHSYGRYTQGILHLSQGRKREAYHAVAARHREHPNDFQPLHYLAYVFRLCNLVDRALAAEQLAVERDPSVPWARWSMVRLLAETGREAEAASIFEEVQARDRDIPTYRSLPLLMLRNQGRFAEIVEQAKEYDRPLEDARIVFEWAYAHARLGNRDEARRLMSNLERFSRFEMDFAVYYAITLAWTGQNDRAFECLTRAADLGNDSVYLFERDDLFGPLHDDPRWRIFLDGARRRAESYRDELRWPIDGSAVVR